MSGLVPYNRNDCDTQKRGDIFNFGRVINDLLNGSFLSDIFPGLEPFKAAIKETDKEYIIEAELPGIRKEDINLGLRYGILTISVERNEQIEEERNNYIRKERRYGSYSRSFHVDDVKPNGVTAKCDNGILTVIAAKDPAAGEKDYKIKITE